MNNQGYAWKNYPGQAMSELEYGESFFEACGLEW